jgi:transcriptional repressor NrdR
MRIAVARRETFGRRSRSNAPRKSEAAVRSGAPGDVRQGVEAIVSPVRCPWCQSTEDRVVDSRLAEDGDAVRRRRECLVCGRRFTTFERVEEVPLWVVKRSGQREPFERTKVVAGMVAACKNRPVAEAELERVAQEVEELMRQEGAEVSSQRIGLAVLERLRVLDEIAYLRFASVYKGFSQAADFAREVGLLEKSTAPKRRA